MRHTLNRSFTLPLPLESTFAFFAKAENLQQITPPELEFHILTPPPIHLGQGTLIDYHLKLCGFPFRWQSQIEVWKPPFCFVDLQLKGPYRLWRHTHRFIGTNNSTTIKDDVEFELPLFPLGETLYPIIRTQLNRIFRFREKAIRKALLPSSEETL